MKQLYYKKQYFFIFTFLFSLLFPFVLHAEKPYFYEYRRATKKLTLRNCPAVDGLNVSTIYVTDYGRYIELPSELGRERYTVTLSPRPMYYACGTDESTGKGVLYARKRIFSRTITVPLTSSDFPLAIVTTPTPSPTEVPGVDPTPPAVGAGCDKYSSWPSAFIYKTIGSTHFSPSDPRRNSIGLVMKPGAKVSTPRCIDILASNASPIAQMGFYARGAGWHARYYGGIGCGTLVNGDGLGKLARDAAGSNNIYVRINGTCYGPIDATKCKGSSQCGR
jgi:hypothetical protein